MLCRNVEETQFLQSEERVEVSRLVENLREIKTSGTGHSVQQQKYIVG